LRVGELRVERNEHRTSNIEHPTLNGGKAGRQDNGTEGEEVRTAEETAN
jgi:hypothetical protein